MIIWLNGGFGAGKTTLAGELHQRLPGSAVFDPEALGLLLWESLPRNDDFQDLASWRELVVACVVSLHTHHVDTVIVPMSLINDAYRNQILGGIRATGADLLHVFLVAEGDVLSDRITMREESSGDAATDAANVAWAAVRIDAAVAAANRLPPGTLALRSDQLPPARLADEVLRAADRAG